MAQSIVGANGFRKQKVITLREGIWYAVPAMAGSILGAMLAVDLNEQILRKVIGALMIVMFFLIILKPEAWIEGHPGKLHAKPTFWQVLLFFAIGLYGGFIQASVGFFLLMGLVLGTGMNLVKANGFKNLIVLLYTPFALLVFILNDQVDWILGLTLAIGNMAGAWLAVKLAIGRGAKLIRIVLLVVLFAASLDMLGVFRWIFR